MLLNHATLANWPSGEGCQGPGTELGSHSLNLRRDVCFSSDVVFPPMPGHTDEHKTKPVSYQNCYLLVYLFLYVHLHIVLFRYELRNRELVFSILLYGSLSCLGQRCRCRGDMA